jgi:hypothetical protein
MNAWAGTDRASGHFCCHALRAINGDISFLQTSITERSTIPLPLTSLCFHAVKLVRFVSIRRASGAGDARSPGYPAMTWSEQDVRASPYHRRSLRSRLHSYLAHRETWTPSPASASALARVHQRPHFSGRSPRAAHTSTGGRRLSGPHYNCSIRTAEAYGEATGRERERARVSMGRQESER